MTALRAEKWRAHAKATEIIAVQRIDSAIEELRQQRTEIVTRCTDRGSHQRLAAKRKVSIAASATPS